MSSKVKLTDKDIRIIYVPPMAIASIHLIGNEPERRTLDYINNFIRENDLPKKRLDFRHFGFNNPDNIPDDDPKHGYERWVSIPENIPVKEPFVKKAFSGGTFAAHMIPWGLWDEGWLPLHNWMETSLYEMEVGDPAFDGTCCWFEEYLNYINLYDKDINIRQIDSGLQLDLLMKIKKKEK